MNASPTGREGQPAVLVSAAALAPEAVAMLQQAGYAVITTSAYPSESELLDAVREHRPVALLHRQGHINGAVLDAAGPGLRVVARHGAGIDGIDVAAAKARGVTVTRAAGANSRAVAEHSWALLLAVLKDLPSIGAGMAGGLWEKTSRHTRDAEGGPSASSATARSAPRLPATPRPSVCRSWPTIPTCRAMACQGQASASERSRISWPAPTSCRCTAR
ncbi:hypothetical protein D3867_29640 (plasmid) [Azospirillum argentinense]|uniref:D-isomer specific 2-hydroxyacid dehydrogenase catalytic domain-containing protein n=1 Tax=Azospirillum brasilense TaxID=192 RepID=A0A4D8Q7T1_AZOBR|nr:hypothetical protein D3867_29640 [Azospirillum argentinense]